jgi:hypothetical protein
MRESSTKSRQPRLRHYDHHNRRSTIQGSNNNSTSHCYHRNSSNNRNMASLVMKSLTSFLLQTWFTEGYYVLRFSLFWLWA